MTGDQGPGNDILVGQYFASDNCLWVEMLRLTQALKDKVLGGRSPRFARDDIMIILWERDLYLTLPSVAKSKSNEAES